MAAVQQAAEVSGPVPTAQVVGNAFVHQYYLILHKSPELVYRFYQDVSKLGRPDDNGVMGSVSSMQKINETILSLNYGKFRAEIKTVDSQDSLGGGVHVLVTGTLIGEDNTQRSFTQAFFLAPQDKGYFVLNDIFRYMDDADNGNQDAGGEVDAPHTSEEVQENHNSEETLVSEKVHEEVHKPIEDGKVVAVEQEPPVAEVIVESHNESQIVVESNPKAEDTPKKSYAFIVKAMSENNDPISLPTPAPSRVAQGIQERQVPSAPSPVPVSNGSIPSLVGADDGNGHEGEGNGYSIYIGGLPPNATPAMLEETFKKFGPIKSGGIQIRGNRQFSFGFVEFEVADAVQRALEESPFHIGGRQAHVETKKASSSRVNKGRYPPGRANGTRNEGARGWGSYGSGRGFNRNDFNNRNEYGNRGSSQGGFQNRSDGYQRADQASGNGGRMNRAGGITFNAVAKNMPPRAEACLT
ncbi:Nuclear transport factor 2 domain [Dillenia turbinata]|uniref:Nuclear transport factor 2 domain n=1 Tax=Dillenia turbinata TaxID=194707 RepID=A0AAN8W328_9MAGN